MTKQVIGGTGAAAKALCPDGFISFADWARSNWTSPEGKA
jgi:hypothetical protein